MTSKRVRDMVAATAELTGTEFSAAAAGVLVADLEGYPEAQLMIALERARKELYRGQFNLAAILARIPDGRPGPEEAWAAVLAGADESSTVVWTEEMRRGWAATLTHIRAGDRVPARMTFLEVYGRECRDARLAARQVQWTVSLGHDPEQRRSALLEAAAKGLIASEHAQRLLAPPARDAGLGLSTPAPQFVRDFVAELKKKQRAIDEAAAEERMKNANDPEFWEKHGVGGAQEGSMRRFWKETENDNL